MNVVSKKKKKDQKNVHVKANINSLSGLQSKANIEDPELKLIGQFIVHKEIIRYIISKTNSSIRQLKTASSINIYYNYATVYVKTMTHTMIAKNQAECYIHSASIKRDKKLFMK